MVGQKKNPPKAIVKYKTRTVEVAKKVRRRVVQHAKEEVHTLSAVGASMLLGAMQSRKVNLPHIPWLGMAGTYGLILWFIGRQTKNRTIMHLGTGLLSVAGFQLAFTHLGPGRLTTAQLIDQAGNSRNVADPFGINRTSTSPADPFAAPSPALTGASYLDNPDRTKVEIMGALDEVLGSLEDELSGDDLDGDDLDGDDLDGDDMEGDDDGLNGDDLEGLDDLEGDDLDGLEDELSGDDLDGDDD